MTCASCGADNREGRKFCGKCAAPLARVCPKCGTSNEPDEDFCGECAAPLDRPAPPAKPKPAAPAASLKAEDLEGERKTVTALFADIKGSTELEQDLDPEEARAIVDPALKLMIDAVQRYDGYVVQSTGDGIFAIFGAPVAHEDHPQRALYAALRMQENLRDYSNRLLADGHAPLGVRVGVNTGEVVVRSISTGGKTEYTPIGHTANLASRMQTLAATGSIAITEHTRRLVEGYFALNPRGPTRIKGVSEPVNVYEVAGVGAARTRFDVSRARGLTAFVGRDADMQTLDAALEQAQAGNGQVVGIVAAAGTGKSRLCFEFLEKCRARGMTIQIGRAVAHGKNIPYLPMLEAFRDYFGITDDDSDRAVREKIAGRLLLTDESLREFLPVVFEFFGAPDPARPVPPGMDPETKQRQFFAVLRKEVREGSAASRLVTLIEDLHWMDAGSEVLLEQWIDAIAGSRGLLIVNFRPEYHASWASKSYYRQIPLAPLGPEAVRELLADLLGTDASIDGLADTIYTRTGGNPFFTEEVVQSLIESGAMKGTRGNYRLVKPIDRLQVPSTVQSILAARIDRLGEREKHLLQAASVIGKDFSEPILGRVADAIAQIKTVEAELRAAMRKLQDAEFILEKALYPVAEYTFKHPLTQEVALGSQLQERRRRTHAAVARALEEAYADSLDETAALLAHHYEEAGDTAKAARWHARAAEWVGLNDIEAAVRHWQRVRELARKFEDKSEADSFTVLACSRVLVVGGWRLGALAAEWAKLFDEGCAAAERTGNLPALATLNATYSAVRGLNQGIPNDYVRYVSEAARIADRTGDVALRCGTRGFLCIAHMFSGQFRESERVCDEVIALAGADPHLGREVGGFTPLLTARFIRAVCIGYMRDPDFALKEIPLVRQAILDSGYPEAAIWASVWEAQIKSATLRFEGLRTLAQAAVRLAENRGAVNEVSASGVACYALASDGQWQHLLEAATDALQMSRERSAQRMMESVLLEHICIAQLELANPEAGRAAAQEGVALIRDLNHSWNPRCYALLALAQFELKEPAEDIASTLDEYAALLNRTEAHIFEGEQYELRARLADREGQSAEQAAALKRAFECYSTSGMTQQAARVKEAMG